MKFLLPVHCVINTQKTNRSHWSYGGTGGSFDWQRRACSRLEEKKPWVFSSGSPLLFLFPTFVFCFFFFVRFCSQVLDVVTLETRITGRKSQSRIPWPWWGERDKPTCRQTDQHTSRQTEKQTSRQTNRPTDKQSSKQADKLTWRQTNRQEDKQKNRQTKWLKRWRDFFSQNYSCLCFWVIYFSLCFLFR